jgi:lipopolysaccharide transport system permease protein
MYISPVVYPLSVIPEKWHYAASFNPMVGIIETARHVIFGTSSLELIYVINGLISTMILFFLGLLIFNRVEKTFLDIV